MGLLKQKAIYGVGWCSMASRKIDITRKQRTKITKLLNMSILRVLELLERSRAVLNQFFDTLGVATSDRDMTANKYFMSHELQGLSCN